MISTETEQSTIPSPYLHDVLAGIRRHDKTPRWEPWCVLAVVRASQKAGRDLDYAETARACAHWIVRIDRHYTARRATKFIDAIGQWANEHREAIAAAAAAGVPPIHAIFTAYTGRRAPTSSLTSAQKAGSTR